MVSRDKKEKQIRMTLQDCLYFQNKLRAMLQLVIKENRCLRTEEKPKYFEILPKSLLSQGAVDPIYIVIEDGWFIFSSVQNLALRLADLSTDKVFLKTSRPEKVEITIPIKDLWQFLYDKVLYLFPQACGEAIHLSAESVERPLQKSFEFTSKEDLNDRR